MGNDRLLDLKMSILSGSMNGKGMAISSYSLQPGGEPEPGERPTTIRAIFR